MSTLHREVEGRLPARLRSIGTPWFVQRSSPSSLPAALTATLGRGLGTADPSATRSHIANGMRSVVLTCLCGVYREAAAKGYLEADSV